ncbi:N-formylglutamate amidohydrolase [Acetobacter oeni]|nr:N-formylglutamate amidohydrolase [Acetobacter oeni]MBB3881748.1 N-formylglutamate amidohydrolase [Acetobacter oeni]
MKSWSEAGNDEEARAFAKPADHEKKLTGTGSASGSDSFVVVRSPGVPIPLIVCSPHSGRNYTAEFLARSRLPLDALRSGEDFHVDTLIATAPQYGATLLCATFPRVVCDVNRASLDLDPRMIENGDESLFSPSERGRAGLGSVPGVVSGGRQVYGRKLSMDETAARLRLFWHPYHAMLKKLIDEMRAEYGFCLVLDMHSMPPGIDGTKADIVIGDRFGSSSKPVFVQALGKSLLALSFSVARNHPFAGGFITSHYGCPEENVSVIQLEMSRALYMCARPGGGYGLNPRFAGKISQIIADMARCVREQQEVGCTVSDRVIQAGRMYP